MTFGISYVIFKKLICWLTSIMLLVVSSYNANLGTPEGAEVVEKFTYVLIDYNASSQGVTNDGQYFYYSGNNRLGKADIKTGKMIRINLSPIPKELSELGCNHIGGLSYYDGKIYASVEDGPTYLHSYIVIYDAETLEYSGTCYSLPWELHTAGVPWCAVDVEKNYIYTAEWDDATVLNVFNLDTLDLVKTIPLSEPVDRIQGAEMFDGILYMSCDEENDMKRIFSVNVETGEVKEVFKRNVGKAVEAEDMTVIADENGNPIFCVLDRAEGRKNTNLTCYKIK